MQSDIKGFQKEYRWLSNFWYAAVVYHGTSFPSVENAYQAAKCARQEDFLKFVDIPAAAAKQLGKKVIRDPEFEANKISIMRNLVRQKFEKNRELAKRLLETGDAYLEETNYWKDTFWGVCNGVGKNFLGSILMEVRHELREKIK